MDPIAVEIFDMICFWTKVLVRPTDRIQTEILTDTAAGMRLKDLLFSRPPRSSLYQLAQGQPAVHSTQSWTRWLQSDCRRLRSHTGWWCPASLGCKPLSYDPPWSGSPCSGHCLWPYLPNTEGGETVYWYRHILWQYNKVADLLTLRISWSHTKWGCITLWVNGFGILEVIS